ncbi:hypothetical protein T265_11525 [Opisthorchis viverrini]|uniref:Uncharacterized protein n=1 Tax=Opisthorchis viverrini TaxID=6198 RepID=A0A074ZX79_OPIVI|nr:hypothetical protein T265_11525 [Opisthorchis viverrini]KER19789.1 hypothetical protein T265_11525 [Opisthorchis viverrini]
MTAIRLNFIDKQSEVVYKLRTHELTEEVTLLVPSACITEVDDADGAECYFPPSVHPSTSEFTKLSGTKIAVSRIW